MMKSIIFRRERLEKMGLSPQTTYQCSYKLPKISPDSQLPFKPVVEKPQALPVYMQIETLTPYRGYMPYDLFFKYDKVQLTNPLLPLPDFEHIEDIDVDKPEVIRTRPRVVMTPALAIDDAPAYTRELIVEDAYVSTWKRAAREAVQKVYSNIKAPLGKTCSKPNMFRLPPLRQSAVEREWKMDTVTWEARQLRSTQHTTREFWQKEDVYRSCPSCKQTRYIKNQEKERK